MNDLESFFERYAERYMASDAQAIAAVYEAPLLAVREGRAIHLLDKTAVHEHLVGLMRAYAEAGAARAVIEALDVLPLGASSAAATIRWHVLDADGGLLRDFRTTYHLLREDETWRILAYTNHD